MLSNILEVSRQNNAQDGITGILMYHDQLFFQVLEGEQTLVEHCYARIVKDQRHTNICLMWDYPVDRKVFSDWAMGYVGPDEIDGHTDGAYRTLAGLVTEESATKDRDIVALELARQMFRGFHSRHARYGVTDKARIHSPETSVGPQVGLAFEGKPNNHRFLFKRA